MHENSFYPGVGEIKKELSAVDNGLNRGIKMTIDEPWIILEVPDKANKNRVHVVPVPISNFKHVVLAKEEVKAE